MIWRRIVCFFLGHLWRSRFTEGKKGRRMDLTHVCERCGKVQTEDEFDE